MTRIEQGRGSGPTPIGVVYNTSMTRPDAALALAALYVSANRRQSRVGAVCVTGAGLDAAIFCDIVNRFYTPGPPRNGNQALAVGLAALSPLPADPPMVKGAVARTQADGAPTYPRSVRRVSDTSLAEAVIRNGVIFSAESAVVLSAPATWLARSLDLAGTPAQYQQRVKRLVIVDTGAPHLDPAALRKVIAEWPSPVFVVSAEAGRSVRFPAAAVEPSFGWTPAHPIADAYRAYRAMPYDAEMHDLVAMLYAVTPALPVFQLSEPGTLSVSESGSMTFTPGGAGTVRAVTIDPAKRPELIASCLDVVSARPPGPLGGSGRG
jgi:hypothetical protein